MRQKPLLIELVKQILDSGDIFTVKEIYQEIEKRINLPPEKKVKTYGSPKYTHAVRATLQHLIDQKEIIRVERGKYRKT